MSERHAFPSKIVNAIIAIRVVCLNFIEQLSLLSTFRTDWTPEYAADLELRVNTAAENLLGKNTRDELFNATKVLNNLIRPVKDDLVTVKKNIEVDFRNNKARADELLSMLGYQKGLTVSAKTQVQLVAILTTFKRALTPAVLTEITEKGLPAAVPNGIAANASTISKANEVQEKLKTLVKETNNQVIREINNLYNEVIGICILAADKLKRDPVKKEMFTFTKVLRNLGETRTAKAAEPAAKSK